MTVAMHRLKIVTKENCCFNNRHIKVSSFLYFVKKHKNHKSVNSVGNEQARED